MIIIENENRNMTTSCEMIKISMKHIFQSKLITLCIDFSSNFFCLKLPVFFFSWHTLPHFAVPCLRIFLYQCALLFRIARAGIIPRSSLLGAGQLGFWEFGKGGTVGWRVGQIGSVYTSNLRRRWTIPVTAGGCQVSERGSKGESARGAKGARGIVPCIYVTVLYVPGNDCTFEWH
jgi:hypothetical protein